MNWTDERVEKLKKLWSEGLSASQIAAQLGGVSRNAVIGKVHRLNLTGRLKSSGSATSGRSAPKHPATLAPHASNYTARLNAVPSRAAVTHSSAAMTLHEDMDLETEKVLDYVPSKHVMRPISRRLTLTELTERTCKWPVGDPLKDDFHFCGCEALESSPYCKFHAKLAYQPVSERRRA